jgi:hypothetical protein
MDPRYTTIVLGAVPRLLQLSPEPFPREALQELFVAITKSFRYQQLAFLPGDAGAQFVNGIDDIVLIQRALVQVATPVVQQEVEEARNKVVSIIGEAVDRLGIEVLMHVGIRVVATVDVPGSAGAREFVAGELLRDEKAAQLGSSFFAGGIKYRSVAQKREENLLIEPLISDDARLWLSYDIGRVEEITSVEPLADWLDEGLEFVREAVRKVLGG